MELIMINRLILKKKLNLIILLRLHIKKDKGSKIPPNNHMGLVNVHNPLIIPMPIRYFKSSLFVLSLIILIDK